MNRSNHTDTVAIIALAIIATVVEIVAKGHDHTITVGALAIIGQITTVKRALYAPPPTDNNGRPTTIPPEPKSATGLMMAPFLLLASYIHLWRQS